MVTVTPEPTRSTSRRVKALSDDVFARLVLGAAGRTFRLIEADDAVDCPDIQQWHTGYELDLEDPRVDLERFRSFTDRWYQGKQLYIGPEGVPPEEMFMDRLVVGRPVLPAGLLWAAHYVDEQTGLVMRAVADHSIVHEHTLCRWDVICG